jgi:hypothetical protein
MSTPEKYVFGKHLDTIPVVEEEDEDKKYQYGTHLPDRNFGEELIRQTGLTARAALGGTAKSLTGINDSILMAGNQIAKWLGMEGEGAKMTSPMVDRALDAVGLPKTENNYERVAQVVGEFVAGGNVFVKGGQIAQKGVKAGKTWLDDLAKFSEAPLAQTASNVGAGLAVGGAVEAGVENPLALMGLGLAGGVVPPVVGSGVGAVTRGAVRGKSTNKMQENIQTFEEAGTFPSVGQATERPGLQGLENTLENMPFGGPVRRQREGQISDIGNTASDIADTLGPKMTNQEVGAAIKEGIVGEGGFLKRSEAHADKLYKAVEDTFNTDRRIWMQNTQDTLNPGPQLARHAPETAKALGSNFMTTLKGALDQDLLDQLAMVGMEGLPYKAVKEMRSAVGRRIDDSLMSADLPKAELKAVYRALSDDLDAGARRYGGEPAAAAADKASAFWKKRMEVIDNIDNVIQVNGGPDKIYKTLIGGTQEGATTLTEILKALKPAERDVFRSAVIRRLGKSKPNLQDAEGGRNSLNTYLTNWNKISPEGKAVLFSHEPDIKMATDAIAQVAANQKLGAERFQNLSGTGRAIGGQSAVVGGIVTVGQALMGDVGPLLAYGATAETINAVARAMTNPTVVRWLARTTQLPIEAAPAALNQLVQIAAETNDPEIMEIAETIKRTP